MKYDLSVIERDKELRKAANELMEMRWHWTADESNPDRVSFREYAKQVGVSHKMISYDVNGWKMFLESTKETSGGNGAVPTGTPTDFDEACEAVIALRLKLWGPDAERESRLEVDHAKAARAAKAAA